LDYVVFGIGFGATILVLGLLLRDVGPRLRYRSSGDSAGVLPADLLVAKVSWTRYCHALGAVLAIGGTIFLLTTLVSIVLMLSDGAGGWVMAGALAVLLVTILSWTWAYFDRFGSYGILPERPAAPAVPEPVIVREEHPRQSHLEEHPEPSEEVPIYGPVLVSAGELDPSDPTASEHHDEPMPVKAGSPPSDLTDSPTDAADNDAHVRSLPRATPEERLAQMEEPLDHGSAAGDLESAPASGRPPSGRQLRAGTAAPATAPDVTIDEQDAGSKPEDATRTPEDGTDGSAQGGGAGSGREAR
jgi:hypothetical protein